MPKITTSGSRLNVREEVVLGDGRNIESNHLQLAFGCKGGGSDGRRLKCQKEPPPARI